MRALVIFVCACSSAKKPPPTIEHRATPAKARPIEPLIIKMDDGITRYAKDGACLIEDSSDVITVEVPSDDDDCRDGGRADDDWFNFELPRKDLKPGDQFVTTISLSKALEYDDVAVPVVARFTLDRDQPPFLVFKVAFLRFGDEYVAARTVQISGELAVRMR